MTIESEETRLGRCLCGAVQYRVSGQPDSIAHCHCRLCQRAAGAAFVTWATYPASQFTWTQGQPKFFASSARGERGFCSACGTPLTFQYPDTRKTIDITLCSLDDPDDLIPQDHIWMMSQRSWIHLNDDLPQYEDAGTDDLEEDNRD
jgi:hypothetical protein